MGKYDDTWMCPYDSNHMMPNSPRIRDHLWKCAKKHTELNLIWCPFNAIHRLKEEELESHILACPDKLHALRDKLRGNKLDRNGYIEPMDSNSEPPDSDGCRDIPGYLDGEDEGGLSRSLAAGNGFRHSDVFAGSNNYGTSDVVGYRAIDHLDMSRLMKEPSNHSTEAAEHATTFSLSDVASLTLLRGSSCGKRKETDEICGMKNHVRINMGNHHNPAPPCDYDDPDDDDPEPTCQVRTPEGSFYIPSGTMRGRNDYPDSMDRESVFSDSGGCREIPGYISKQNREDENDQSRSLGVCNGFGNANVFAGSSRHGTTNVVGYGAIDRLDMSCLMIEESHRSTEAAERASTFSPSGVARGSSSSETKPCRRLGRGFSHRVNRLEEARPLPPLGRSKSRKQQEETIRPGRQNIDTRL